MNLQEFLNFGKVIMTAYDNITTDEQDAEFRAKLQEWATFALNALGAGVIAYITNYFTAQIAKLQAKINEMTAPKPPKP
mgnify:CR=1 FL=1